MVDLYSRFAICFGFYSCEMFEAQFFGLLGGTLPDQWPLALENYLLSFWSWNTSEIATLVHVATFHEACPRCVNKKTFIFTKQKRNVAVGVHWKDQGPISWNPGRLMDSQKNNKIYVKGIPRIPRSLGLVYLHAFRWLRKVHVSKYLHKSTIQMFFWRVKII